MIEKINYLAKNKIPFFFIIDYDVKNFEIFYKKTENPNVLFNINGIKNYNYKINNKSNNNILIKKQIVPYNIYKNSFDIIKNEFLNGNTFLVNLTFPTDININLSLEDIFYMSNAKYKILYKNKFVVFSPEIFIQIKNGKIYSFPMKGTIDASIPNAEKIILEDEKELAEHITIVDLIRNDIGMVSSKVKVNRFRYIDTINTNNKKLLQVSSEIEGTLPYNYLENLGDIIFKLLPAGSICGAPKKETLSIIKKSEIYKRGYYTGIAGYFDGENLDSCVMIRFIEQNEDKLIFKSGGGITVYSNPEKEYKEMEDKIYVPIYWNYKDWK